jgi:hypothetical protein
MMTETWFVDNEGNPVDEVGTRVPRPDWAVATIINSTTITFYQDIFQYLDHLAKLTNNDTDN